MVAFTKFDQFKLDLAHKVHNLGSDSFKIALSNTAPNPSTGAVLADITQISAGNGYVAGGFAVSRSASALFSGTYELRMSDNATALTASGGSIGPFRYCVLYNDTPTSPADPLIGYWDLGAAQTMLDGQPFNFDVTDANGKVLSLA